MCAVDIFAVVCVSTCDLHEIRPSSTIQAFGFWFIF